MSLIDDAVLLKMAEDEILGEARRAAVRYSIAGVSGWQPCSKTNKTFLTNTLLQTMASNRILSKKKGNKPCMGRKSERKLLKTNRIEKDANFVYRKPVEKKEKSALNTFSNKVKKGVEKKKIKSTKESNNISTAKKVKKKG